MDNYTLKDPTTFHNIYLIDTSDIGKNVLAKRYLAQEAALALGEIGPDADTAVEDLLVATKDSRPEVKVAAIGALGKIRSAAAVPKLMTIFDTAAPGKYSSLVKITAEALAEIGEPAVPALLKARDAKSYSVRLGAALALGQIRPVHKEAAATLRPYLKDGMYPVRLTVIEILHRMGPDAKDAVPDLVAMLAVGKENILLRPRIAAALGEIGESAGPAIVKSAKHESVDAHRWAAFILGKMKSPPPEAVATLTELLSKDSNAAVRVAAANSLAEFGADAKSALPVIQQRAESDSNSGVRLAADKALKKIRE